MMDEGRVVDLTDEMEAEHALDKAWRWCKPEEMQPALLQKHDPMIKEGEPTEGGT